MHSDTRFAEHPDAMAFLIILNKSQMRIEWYAALHDACKLLFIMVKLVVYQMVAKRLKANIEIVCVPDLNQTWKHNDNTHPN